MFDTASDVLVIISLISLVVQRGAQQYEASPCPKIFIYQYDQNRGLYGEIQIPYISSNTLQLNIELSVGNAVQGYNGNIELSKPKDQVIQDIMHKQPISYKVFFPVWTQIPPKITKIVVNGNLICSGPKIPMNLVPIITTINLQHMLKVDLLPLVPSNAPQENNIFYPGDESPRRYNYNIVQVPGRSPSASETPLRKTHFDFNPKESREPSKVYPKNPFIDASFDQFYRPDGSFNESDEDNEAPTSKSPPTESPLKKNLFKFYPKRPRDRSKINKTNPFIGTPLEEFYRPGGVFKELALIPYQLNQPTTQQPFAATTTPQLPQRDSIFPTSPTIVYNNFSPKGVESASSEPYGSICGKPIATNSLIINGNEVPRGAYPWLAALFGVRPAGLNYMCSASLISDRHVVTAAHCMKKDNKILRPNDLLIILGKLNIQKWVPSDGEKMIEVDSIHVHPDYKDFTSDADVAVLVLSETVQFTKFIRPLCLWSGETELEKIIGKQGTVVGWGKDENGVLMTAEPKQTQLPVVGQETCLRSSYQFQYITSNRTFCAGFRNGSGPCNGDSGSGFIIQQQGRWMLRGIVSMSISDNHARTCDLSNYVVFTDARLAGIIMIVNQCIGIFPYFIGAYIFAPLFIFGDK